MHLRDVITILILFSLMATHVDAYSFTLAGLSYFHSGIYSGRNESDLISWWAVYLFFCSQLQAKISAHNYALFLAGFFSFFFYLLLGVFTICLLKVTT